MMLTSAEFLEQVEAYLVATKIPPTTFGVNAVKDPNFIFRVRKGRRPNLDTIGKVLAYMQDNPPPVPAATAAPQPATAAA